MQPALSPPFVLLGLGLTAPVAVLGHGFDDLQAGGCAVGRIKDVLAVLRGILQLPGTFVQDRRPAARAQSPHERKRH